jgi:hypothetical protein
VKATKNLYILKQCSTECEGAVHVIKRIQPSNCRSMDSNSRVLDVSGGFAFSCRIYSHRSSFTREMCLSTFSPLAAQPPPALPPPQARRPPVAPHPSLVSVLFAIYMSVLCKVATPIQPPSCLSALVSSTVGASCRRRGPTCNA